MHVKYEHFTNVKCRHDNGRERIWEIKIEIEKNMYVIYLWKFALK